MYRSISKIGPQTRVEIFHSNSNIIELIKIIIHVFIWGKHDDTAVPHRDDPTHSQRAQRGSELWWLGVARTALLAAAVCR